MPEPISRRDLLGAAVGIGIGLHATPGEAAIPATTKEAPGAVPPPAPGPKVNTSSLPPRSIMELPAGPPAPEWLRTHLRRGHLPPADWRQIDEYLKAGYNVVAVNALRKWDVVGPAAALYPEQEVKEAEVYLRRLATTIHGAGAKAVLYIGPVQTPAFSPEFVKAHPDWLRVNADGKTDAKPNFVNFRHPEFVKWLLGQFTHLTREYQFDGYWLDGYAPVHLHTYDEATRRLFREHSGGQEIPKPVNGAFDLLRDPVARDYLAWHEQYFVDLAGRMRAAIRGENPSAVLFANHSGNRTWYFPNAYMGEYPGSYSSAIDVSSVELYWDVPGDALYQQFVYAFMQGTVRDRDSTVWIQPSEHGISGISSPVEIQLRGLEGPPWGVYPEFVESTGREEYAQLHIENTKARDPWWTKSEPLSYIGIVASEQTRTLHSRGALPVYFSHTLGAFRSVFEKHWPVRVLTEYDLEDAMLRGVRVLVLPNVACLSDRAAEVIRRFVRAGGGLVASFETSLYDSQFRRRDDFALGDLFRAKYVATHPVELRTDNLMLTLGAPHPITDDPVIRSRQNTSWRNPYGAPPEQGTLALIASATEVKAAEGTTTLATYRVATPGKSDGEHPAILASEYGAGRVVYFPASVDKGMFFYPDAYMRQLLTNACRWVAKDTPPPVEVSGPLILVTTFRYQPEERRVVVHLLNHGSSWGMHSIYQKLAPLPEELRKQYGFPDQSELRGTWPIREEIIPLHEIRVTCRMPGVRRATLQPENQPLELKLVPGGVEVTVPKLEMHSMVIFE